MKVEILTKYKF